MHRRLKGLGVLFEQGGRQREYVGAVGALGSRDIGQTGEYEGRGPPGAKGGEGERVVDEEFQDRGRGFVIRYIRFATATASRISIPGSPKSRPRHSGALGSRGRPSGIGSGSAMRAAASSCTSPLPEKGGIPLGE
ncbi:hypothetical protein [Streptomyces sp. NBC_00448]|uniref:hypothetical protein n=1 Tax=Streptomyces sp. NBC_00448 TaxID=2903652 RepID=UPI002E1FEB77